MAEIKFSELEDIGIGIENLDVFAVSDNSDDLSKKISFQDLKQTIVNRSFLGLGEAADQLSSSNNITSLIDVLNLKNYGGLGNNNLNATKLFHNSAYRTSDYFLNYENIQNTPTIPTDLSDLTNETGFLSYDADLQQVIWDRGTDTAALGINTNLIPEGTSNLYYTDNRVATYLQSNFSDFLGSVTQGFDDGSVYDSYVGAPATFQNVSQSQSNTIRVDVPAIDGLDLKSFRFGSVLRIYGASLDNTLEQMLNYPSYSSVLDVNGFSGPTFSEEFTYKTALFDTRTGKITDSLDVIGTATLNLPDGFSTIEEAFNQNNFIRLTFSNVPAFKGVLVYRQRSAEIESKLVAVLGPKEVFQGFWDDYFKYDYVGWGGKSDIDNSYVFPDGSISCIHFPRYAPTVALRGWQDATITSVTENTDGSVNVLFSETLYVNPGFECEICHNDTNTLQTAINSNSASGSKVLRLNAKRYVSEKITVPDDFAIEGVAGISGIFKLPWSGGDSLDGSMIQSQTRFGANRITITDLNINGEAINQFLLSDESERSTNYVFDFGESPSRITMDQVNISNVIGGGVYAPNSQFVKINISEVRDSGLTDRNLYSPLIINNGDYTQVSNSIFENFTDALDASGTVKGAVSNNIISNCGSGLFIYGSRFLLSSQNILAGPANEFLPNPDIFNSEYDFINIKLTFNQNYISDVYLYQENGFPFDLKRNLNNRLIYEVYKLKKSSETGQESLYDDPLPDITLNPRAGLDQSNGEFGFEISTVDVNTLLTTYNYDTLSDTTNGGDADHVGLVYRVSLEEIVNSGDIITTSNGIVLATYAEDLAGNPTTNNLLGSDFNGHYQFFVDNASNILSEGAYIQLADHLEFAAQGILSDGLTGLITKLQEVPGENNRFIITADFGTITSTGFGGTINRLNVFTLAEGRIT